MNGPLASVSNIAFSRPYTEQLREQKMRGISRHDVVSNAWA